MSRSRVSALAPPSSKSIAGRLLALVVLVTTIAVYCHADSIGDAGGHHHQVVPETQAKEMEPQHDANHLHKHPPTPAPPPALAALNYSAPPGTKPIRVAMQNWYDRFYAGYVAIGNPPREFQVAFDTKSNDFWVSSKKCRACTNRNSTVYDSSGSSSYRAANVGSKGTFEIRYGDERHKVQGLLSADDVWLDKTRIPGQVFGETMNISGLGNWYLHVDGIFGLAPRPTSSAGAKMPFQNMLDQRLVPEPVFSVHLSNHISDNSLDGEPVSEILFGGTDSNLYTGKITYAPIFDTGFWQFRLDGVSFREPEAKRTRMGVHQMGRHDGGADHGPAANEFICEKGCQAILDSTSYLILGPKVDVTWLAGRVGAVPARARRNGDYDLWRMPSCQPAADLPNIAMTIAGRKFILTPKQYVIRGGFIGPEGCLFGFAGYDDDEHDWTLGQIFMRAHYTVFDYGKKRIGFAQATDYRRVESYSLAEECPVE